MARRTNNIEVAVVGEADFGRARRDAARDLGRIEKEAEGTAADIKRAFDRVELSPELDTADIKRAIDLAEDLDGMVAKFTVDTDLEEIQQAEKIARSLRAFQGRVDLSVEGRAELQDALGLADKLDQIRTVKVQVQGQKDLQRAGDLADNIGNDLAQAGQQGADGIADAIGGINFDGIGRQGLDSLTGALTAAGPWGAAAGAIAAVFGDELIDGFTAGFDRRRRDMMRALTSGLGEQDLAASGRRAGDAWAAGFGESRQELQATADELTRILDGVATGAELGPVTKQAQALADVFGVDVRTSALLAGRAIKQGLADDVADAFDDMIGAAQEFGATGIEALDVYQEFGANFARFGVDGGRAIRFIAESFEDGLFPTIDRAGELFEEFTTRITDADAIDAIEEIGLNFEKVQRDVAKGGDAANAAMSAVVVSLMNYGTESDRARLSNVIFGQSMEQVSDHGAVLAGLLELLSNNTDAFAGSAEDATDAVESMVTPLDRAQRGVSDLAMEYGELVNMSLGWFFDFRDAVDWVSEELFGLDQATDQSTEGHKRFAKAAEDATEASIGTGRSFVSTADYAGDLEREIRDVTDALDDLFDFGADRLMRDIAESADDLVDAFTAVDRAAFGMNGEFDITTEAGRRAQSQMERLNRAGRDLAVAYAQGEISQDEYRRGMVMLIGALDRAGNEAGLTKGQIASLRQQYLLLAGADPIKLTIDYDGSFATNEINRFLRLQKTGIKVPLGTSGGGSGGGGGGGGGSTITRRSGGSAVTRRAHGGPATGLTLVGEEGPELLDLGSDRGFVTDAATTSRMINAAASSFTGGGGGGGRTGSTPVVIEIRSGGSGLDDMLVEVLRKSIRNRGGNVSAVLG